jgi:hypothetical protein
VCSRAGGASDQQQSAPTEAGDRRQARAAWGWGSGMVYCVGVVLGVRPLGHRVPAEKNSDIFYLFKHFQIDLN